MAVEPWDFGESPGAPGTTTQTGGRETSTNKDLSIFVLVQIQRSLPTRHHPPSPPGLTRLDWGDQRAIPVQRAAMHALSGCAPHRRSILSNGI